MAVTLASKVLEDKENAMHDASNRFVVLISALLTLLVLGGATLAIGFRNGWLRVATAAASRDATPSTLEAGATQAEVVVTEHDDDHRERDSRLRESGDD